MLLNQQIIDARIQQFRSSETSRYKCVSNKFRNILSFLTFNLQCPFYDYFSTFTKRILNNMFVDLN